MPERSDGDPVTVPIVRFFVNGLGEDGQTSGSGHHISRATITLLASANHINYARQRWRTHCPAPGWASAEIS